VKYARSGVASCASPYLNRAILRRSSRLPKLIFGSRRIDTMEKCRIPMLDRADRHSGAKYADKTS